MLDHRSHLHRRRAGRAAFTLVELLVVIGIIGVLVSIFLPALGKARRLGIRAACLSNMREVGNGLQMYLVDSLGVLPPHLPNHGPTSVVNFADEGVYDRYPSFVGSVVPYLKDRRILACPGIDPHYIHPWHGEGATPTSDTNYSGNGVLAGMKVSRVKRSSEIVILQEWVARDKIYWLRPAKLSFSGVGMKYAFWHDNNTPKATEDYTNCHEGGGNVLFVDGHAEWRAYTAMRASDFGLISGPGATGKADDRYDSPTSNIYDAEFN